MMSYNTGVSDNQLLQYSEVDTVHMLCALHAKFENFSYQFLRLWKQLRFRFIFCFPGDFFFKYNYSVYAFNI